MAKSEVQGTIRISRCRQEDSRRVHEVCYSAKISHNSSIIKVVCTNIYLNFSDNFQREKVLHSCIRCITKFGF